MNKSNNFPHMPIKELLLHYSLLVTIRASNCLAQRALHEYDKLIVLESTPTMLRSTSSKVNSGMQSGAELYKATTNSMWIRNTSRSFFRSHKVLSLLLYLPAGHYLLFAIYIKCKRILIISIPFTARVHPKSNRELFILRTASNSWTSTQLESNSPEVLPRNA